MLDSSIKASEQRYMAMIARLRDVSPYHRGWIDCKMQTLIEEADRKKNQPPDGQGKEASRYEQ